MIKYTIRGVTLTQEKPHYQCPFHLNLEEFPTINTHRKLIQNISASLIETNYFINNFKDTFLTLIKYILKNNFL